MNIKYENTTSLSPFENLSKAYEFIIKINLRSCKLGEVLKKSLLTTECEACPKLYYSLKSPDLFPDTKCLKCPANVSCLGGDVLELEPG